MKNISLTRSWLPIAICIFSLIACKKTQLTNTTTTPIATVTTFAGNGTSGTTDGTGTAVQFRAPAFVATDAARNIYVTDEDNNNVRKITPAGVVSTFAGSTSGFSGNADGTGTAASFNTPQGLAVDIAGNIYVADKTNNNIRKITPAGVVTTFAGSNVGTSGSVDGAGTAARFNRPVGIALDKSGNIYVADQYNNSIRKITPAGVVSTFAGSTSGISGTTDGTGTAARFNFPGDIAIDMSGNIYVADENNNSIRKITSTGVVTTFAGSTAGSSGNVDGVGTAARFQVPIGVTIDAKGNMYVADRDNNSIRKITPDGTVTTFAGNTSSLSGNTDGTGVAARFNGPIDIAVDVAGNFYVADISNRSIRKITVQ